MAEAIDRYRAGAGDVRLEISAPRDDIVRVRAGRGSLPEDASWAVLPRVRERTSPFGLVETAETAVLKTAQAEVRIDRRTLAIVVLDLDGRVVLADAPGSSLDFQDDGFRLRKTLEPGLRVFGLGDKTGPLDRRGRRYQFWNTDAFEFGLDADPLYKTIPFAIGLDQGGGAFGLFMDSTWRGFMDVGQAEPDVLAFGAEGGGVDYYVLTGRTPKDIVQAYAFLTGAAPLTPLWALGFQQSRWSYMSQADVEGVADRLRAERIPADAVYLDIDFQDRNRPFTVNAQAFPDLPALCSRLASQGLKVVAITDLHIAVAPGEAYAPYDSGVAQDVFLRNRDGEFYVGEAWPGPSVFPDFSRPAVRRWWGALYAPLLNAGVAGFWNDMNEPAILETTTKTMPLDVVHRIEEPGFASRQAIHAEMHNVVGSLNARATYEGLLAQRPDQRPFVLTRAAYAGGHRHAATWTGDNVSSFEHLMLSIRQLIALGLGGFAYAGADVGGFGGEAPSPELLTRWIQIGAFTPLFRLHCKTGKPPQEVWVHGPRHTAIRRRSIEERYRLMPYLYGLAEENSRTGLPIMRSLFLEFPDSPAAVAEHLFMLGPDLLIAPSPHPDRTEPYVVRLPCEGWYDYWTGARIASAEHLTAPSLERLPVFVRPGAIIPRQPLVQSTAERPNGALELVVYPGPHGARGALYFDDGATFAYRRGDFLRQSVTMEARAIVFGLREGDWRPWWREIEITVRGDGDADVLTVRTPDLPAGGRLELPR